MSRLCKWLCCAMGLWLSGCASADLEQTFQETVGQMIREQHPDLDDAGVEAQVQKALAEVRQIKKHTPTFLTVDRPNAKDFDRQLKLADGRFRLLEEAEAAWNMVAWLAAKRKADELSKPQSELFAELVRAQWNELNLGFASPNAQKSLQDFDQDALSIGTEERVEKMTAFYLDRVRLLVLLGNVNYGVTPDLSDQLEIVGRRMREIADFNAGRVPTASAMPHGPQGVSWRVALLASFDHSDLFQTYRYQEPWDSEGNRAFIARMPRAYQTDVKVEGHTTLHFLSGQGAPFAADEPVNFREPSDRWSRTIMAVVGTDETAVPWIQPGGLEFDPANPLALLAERSGGHPILLADGRARLLSAGTPTEIVLQLIQGSELDPSVELEQYLQPFPSSTIVR